MRAPTGAGQITEDHRSKSKDRNTQEAGTARQRVTYRDEEDDRYGSRTGEHEQEHIRCRSFAAVKGKVGNSK